MADAVVERAESQVVPEVHDDEGIVDLTESNVQVAESDEEAKNDDDADKYVSNRDFTHMV